MIDEDGAERTFASERFGNEGQLEQIDVDRRRQLSSAGPGLVLDILSRYPRGS